MVSNQTIVIRAIAKNLDGITYNGIISATGLNYSQVRKALEDLRRRRLVKSIPFERRYVKQILINEPNSIRRTKRLCPDWQPHWEAEWNENVFKKQV